MSGSTAAAKAAPKTLHQFRNFSYILVAWLGFNKGFREKRANDNAWVEHQQRIRQRNAEQHQAAYALRESQRGTKGEAGVPEVVPQDLHELYKDMEKAIQ